MSGLLLAVNGLMLACSVCYGDPDSDLARGATAGVLVMVGVVVSVLMWISGVTLFFVRRAKRMSEPEDTFLPGDLGPP